MTIDGSSIDDSHPSLTIDKHNNWVTCRLETQSSFAAAATSSRSTHRVSELSSADATAERSHRRRGARTRTKQVKLDISFRKLQRAKQLIDGLTALMSFANILQLSKRSLSTVASALCLMIQRFLAATTRKRRSQPRFTYAQQCQRGV